MNPIHESIFASMLLLMAVAPWLLLLALASLILSLLRKATSARVLVVLSLLPASLVGFFAALDTESLHGDIEAAIQRGGYGAPDFARKQYAKEIAAWHASAKEPSVVALILLLLIAALALPAWFRRVRPRKKADDASPVLRGWETIALVCAALAALADVAVSL